MRLRPVEQFPVEEDVDLLVVKGDQSGDRLKLPGREVVGPGQVGVHGLADPDRPVSAGGALVRARGLRLGGDQVIEVRIAPIQVVGVGSPVSKTMTGQEDSASTTPSSSTRTARVERSASTLM